MKIKERKFKQPEVGEIPEGRIEIEGEKFSLLYDYDREKLKRLSDEGKIEWFKERMRFIFINPVRLLWDRSSELYKQVNTDEMPAVEHCGFNIAIFCTVLSGVESYGAFLKGVTKHDRENKSIFAAYVQKYMSEWYTNVKIDGQQKHITDLLWDKCRNAIAHGFRIMEIGIDFIEEKGVEKNWGWIKKIFHINCFKFFFDFVESASSFYRDIDADPAMKSKFVKTFNAFYPVN